MNTNNIHRTERLSQLLDELRKPNSSLRDPDTLRQRYPDLADEALALLDQHDELRSMTTESQALTTDLTTEQTDQTHSLHTGEETRSYPQELPKSFGRYHILRRLGEGGMGTVYEAHDPQLQRRVALKIPHFSGSEEKKQQSQRRFLREARAAAAIEHANVCPIYDVGEQDGRPFVVMAFVEGESLAERLQKSPIGEPELAVQLILKVANGLAAVHGHGIVHRDLKPGNILIRQKDGEPILTDFGLAQTTHDDDNLTAEGAILGTPAYMAPEQANPSLGPINVQSDLYGLGVILFELVTGRRPFSGSAMQIMMQVISLAVPRASEWRADLDPKLDAIIAKATARNREDRFATAEEFSRQLSAWLQKDGLPSTVLNEPRSGTSTRPRWLMPRVLKVLS